MKKKIRDFQKYILCFLAGILVVGSISVYAVTTIIDSKEVSYDNKASKGSYDNVQLSIDELYKRYKDFTGEQDTIYKEEILNGADPVLGDEMIPITLEDDGTVKYANLYTPWYKYEEKKWANAVILVDNPSQAYKTGDTILEKDVESYFVWIPKYSYKIWDLGNYTKGYALTDLKDINDENDSDPTAFRHVANNSRIIDVRFGKNENLTTIPTTTGVYYTHPAFTNFGVSGLWVGKFETGYNQGEVGQPISDTSSWTSKEAQKNVVASNKIIIKPNVYSWRNISIGNIFKTTMEYESNLKSHMMKNTEWGAAAYLSHSIYGIGTEININNNENYITGCSSTANANQTSTPGEYGTKNTLTQAYNTTTGYLASTTGNITGIYDMSGGAWELMASYMENYGITTATGLTSGLTTTDLAKTEYFDRYSNDSSTRLYNQRILGDATGELGPFFLYYEKSTGIFAHNGWYSDYSDFVYPDLPWFVRGGNYNQGTVTGQFSFARTQGPGGIDGSFRIVLAIK